VSIETGTDARAEIRSYIEPKFPGLQLADDQDIFSLGFVNSLFAMELVLFLEKMTGARIPNDELNLDNFRSVDAMSGLVDRLVPAAVAGDA
jgi:methoxymalonate biosynthesis acyl carrier protein